MANITTSRGRGMAGLNGAAPPSAIDVIRAEQVGTEFFDTLDGTAGHDAIYGRGGDDYIVDDLGGHDQLFGEGGWDSISVSRYDADAPSEVVLDGAAGLDVLGFFSVNFVDHVTINGGDDEDSISAFRGATVTIDAGAGNDRVGLYFLGAITTVRLGDGTDFLALGRVYEPIQSGGSITVLDFAAGDSGDRLELLDFLDSTLIGWNRYANPFASQHLRLVEQGSDSIVQIDFDGTGAESGFIDLVRLAGHSPSELTQYNLGGFAPDGAAPSTRTIVGTPVYDLLWGGMDADLIQAGDGFDQVFGGTGDDVIEGGLGKDLLDGQLGDDQLFGGDDEDNLLESTGGNDQLFGEAGNDRILVARQVDASPSILLLDGGLGNDALVATMLNDDLNHATLRGGDGNDDLYAGGGGQVFIEGGIGTDYVELSDLRGRYAITLGDDYDQLYLNPFLTDPESGFEISVADFDPGEWGSDADVLFVRDFLNAFTTWDGAADPFATGHLLLGQSGADTILFFRPEGAGGAPLELVRFANLPAGTLTAHSLGGFVPTAAIPVGTDEADRLNGAGGADLLIGLDGNDVLNGGEGSDSAFGGAGDDIYVVDAAGDRIVEAAGEGSDRILANAGFALSAGSEVELITAADQRTTFALNLTGNEFGQFLFGNDGVNRLEGGGGNDTLFGNAGNDTLVGGAGSDVAVGGLGDDLYLVDGGDAVIEAAGQGNDRVLVAASYHLTSNSEVELISAADQSATFALKIVGNAFGQLIIANAGANHLAGGGGNDTLWGLAGNDLLDGGLGADSAVGGAGDDVYAVDNAADLVFETAGNGTDRVLASTSYALGAGADIELLATANQASVVAYDLTGNALANNIQANAGHNTLRGLGGNDVLFGLGGNDVLNGGAGVDQLNGGGGADTHVFADALGPTNVDFIFGFASGTDRIQLDNAVFAALADGALAAGAFRIGATALEADDRILYDQATGRLYYDADGSGAAAAAIHFATVNAPLVVASDFTVI